MKIVSARSAKFCGQLRIWLSTQFHDFEAAIGGSVPRWPVHRGLLGVGATGPVVCRDEASTWLNFRFTCPVD